MKIRYLLVTILLSAGLFLFGCKKSEQPATPEKEDTTKQQVPAEQDQPATEEKATEE